jgi:hypothetical protein
MKPPPAVERQRSRYFAPLRIFFAEDPSGKHAEAHGKRGAIPHDAKPRVFAGERRRLPSGCELITLKTSEKSTAFSLSKGK